MSAVRVPTAAGRSRRTRDRRARRRVLAPAQRTPDPQRRAPRSKRASSPPDSHTDRRVGTSGGGPVLCRGCLRVPSGRRLIVPTHRSGLDGLHVRGAGRRRAPSRDRRWITGSGSTCGGRRRRGVECAGRPATRPVIGAARSSTGAPTKHSRSLHRGGMWRGGSRDRRRPGDLSGRPGRPHVLRRDRNTALRSGLAVVARRG